MYKCLTVFLVLSVTTIFNVIYGEQISLDGRWIGIIESCNLTFPATVPGGIYTDLSKVNLIPKNLIDQNDLFNRWIGNVSVVYTKNFYVPAYIIEKSEINLVFHGLDTFATIFLNDVEIGETSNMFLRYTFDVKERIKVGKNQLRVTFRSAVKVAEHLYNEQSKRYSILPKCVPKEYNGECHVNHIRKMQASFSWDWGPAFPSMGIWKPVELVSTNSVYVTDVTTDIYNEAEAWKIIVTTFFKDPRGNYEENTLKSCFVRATLHIDETFYVQNISTCVIQTEDENDYRSAFVVLYVPTHLVERWWPNGYGKQKLYRVTSALIANSEMTERNIQVGFRTVELVEEPLKKGLSFYFRVNNVPIFAKGSNFIPASIFPELSADRNTVTHLLLSAREAHMNMLRVWGGGMYESKMFYELADKYGIMIWQDFMFACAMYPTGEAFLKSVREEVTQNVRRLKNHPSIVLWAGNNENEAALYGNWYGTGTEKVYRDDYIKLYIDVIKAEVEQLDPVRPFVVSSPGNGIYAEQYNFIGENPYSDLYGDVHYYNYLRNGWDINQYPRARFSSEYGFQALPSFKTLMEATSTPAEDLQLDSMFMKCRQHLPFGYQFMKALISKNFVIPKSNDSIKDLADFIYLSQINQAVSVRVQTEFYRQSRSEINSIGEGMTMGALYWQLNDVWQAPSWSSIEFGGRWKMLHYYALHFFAPVIVTSHLTPANELLLYVVSDDLQKLSDCVITLNVYRWNSMNPIYSETCCTDVFLCSKTK